MKQSIKILNELCEREGYINLGYLGRGGNASVYKVKHEKLGYFRAIKILKDCYIEDENDPLYRPFLKECVTLLKINHQSIVKIYRHDLIDHCAVVEMQYIKGVTLNNFVKEKKFVEYKEVETFIEDIVGALAYTHHDIYNDLMDPEKDNLDLDPNDGKKYVIPKEKEIKLVDKYGIVHNDLHSNNVMRCDLDGRFVLLDFGISKQNGEFVKSCSKFDGHPEYKAPEKFTGGEITFMSDVYSLGILMYEILAGRPPFIKDSLEEKHRYETPPSIYPLREEAFKSVVPGAVYERDYPEWLEKMIMKCLSKSPKDRYTDARELLDDINRHKCNDQKQTHRSKDDSQSGRIEPDKPLSQPQDKGDISKGNNKGRHKPIWGIILATTALAAVLASVLLWRFQNEASAHILIEEISLPSAKYELTIGDTLRIIPKVKPSNATDTMFRWMSSNPNIVRIEGNNFIAVNKGTSIVTVANESGTVTSSTSIWVNDIETNKENTTPKIETIQNPATTEISGNIPPITSNRSDHKPESIEIPNSVQGALNMLIDNAISIEARLNSINRIIEIYFEQEAKICTIGETDIILDYENVEDFLRRIALSRGIAGIEIIGSEKHEKLVELSVREIK